MMKKTKQKKSTGSATFQAVLLVLLTLTLAVQVVVYVGGTHIYERMTGTDETVSFERLWSVQNSAQTGFNGERLLPELVGYKLTGQKAKGSIGDREAIRELYGLVKPCLTELFGSSAICERLTAETGEDLFLGAASGEEFVYLRYHVPTLYQLIFAYASDKLAMDMNDVASWKEPPADEDEGAYIRELFIVPERDPAAHRYMAVASDGEGHYFLFSQSEEIVRSDFYISKLDAGGQSISTSSFAFAADSGETRLKPTFPMFEGDLLCEVLTCGSAGFESEQTTKLLELFEYNPDKLNSYRDETGALVCVDSHSRLRIGEELVYQAADAKHGIRLDTLLGYAGGGEIYSLFDRLMAADHLITSVMQIDRKLVGGEASLCLGRVWTEDSVVAAEYFLTYDNIRLTDGAVIRVYLSSDTLCGFELTPTDVGLTDTAVRTPSRGYILNRLSQLGLLPDGALDMTLRYTDGRAEWNVIA